MYLYFVIFSCLMVYDVYFLCELHLLSLKIFIFVSFKNLKNTGTQRNEINYYSFPNYKQ